MVQEPGERIDAERLLDLSILSLSLHVFAEAGGD
jgi:hypothetical protein